MPGKGVPEHRGCTEQGIPSKGMGLRGPRRRGGSAGVMGTTHERENMSGRRKTVAPGCAAETPTHKSSWANGLAIGDGFSCV